MGPNGGHVQRIEEIDIRKLKNKVLTIKENEIK
jgi:hypothetical protein